jgi:hypothetical protein
MQLFKVLIPTFLIAGEAVVSSERPELLRCRKNLLHVLTMYIILSGIFVDEDEAETKSD